MALVSPNMSKLIAIYPTPKVFFGSNPPTPQPRHHRHRWRKRPTAAYDAAPCRCASPPRWLPQSLGMRFSRVNALGFMADLAIYVDCRDLWGWGYYPSIIMAGKKPNKWKFNSWKNNLPLACLITGICINCIP